MDIKDLRIVFMGTPEISATVLESLIISGLNIVGVVAQPDRPVGRKQILTPVPTKIIAEKYNIPTYQKEKIRLDYEFLKEINPDLIITLAYGQIVPQGLLDIPKYGCLNLHGSLLPKYRGAAPIQYALINQEKETGMTLMEMIDKMDAGKMYAKEIVTIDEEDNATSLFIKMGKAATKLVLDNLQNYIDGKLIGEVQDESLVSFAPSIKKEEEKIDLNKTSKEIVGYIKALSEVPGAYLLLNEEKFKIYKAKYVNDQIKGQVGEIIQMDKTGIFLQCKDGIINLLVVQKVGKNKLDYINYVNGNMNLLHSVLK